MKLDKGEVHIRKSNPECTVWDDGEEPVSIFDESDQLVYRNQPKLIPMSVKT